MWWEGTERTVRVGKGPALCPSLPEEADAPGVPHVAGLGRSGEAAQSRTGALCLRCPAVRKEPEGKSPLNHEKTSFSV